MKPLKSKILKFFRWLGISIVSLLVLTTLGLLITGNGYLLKAISVVYLTGHSSAYLDDYIYFKNRSIDIGKPKAWPLAHDYNQAKSTAILDSIHQHNRTIAYLIIKNDSLWFEKYYDGYNEKSKTNSFSMAKSVVAAALGKAIELGYIKSLDERVINYLPNLKGPFAKDLRIKHLVSMQSGLQWDENYTSPFSITTKAYFYNNLSLAMYDLPIASMPGQKFKYQSGDTQLLAMVLSKAIPTTLSDFTSNYLWKPMQSEQEALWQYSSADGIEKAYCCIASNARDFARFGKLYKDKGKWNNLQVLDSAYIEQSTIPADPQAPQYGYGWWLGEYESKKLIYMDGHLGQYVIAIPQDNLIIVRLGHQKDKLNKTDPQSAFYQYIDQAYKILAQNKTGLQI